MFYLCCSVLPVVMDITINLPEETQVILKVRHLRTHFFKINIAYKYIVITRSIFNRLSLFKLLYFIRVLFC